MLSKATSTLLACYPTTALRQSTTAAEPGKALEFDSPGVETTMGTWQCTDQILTILIQKGKK